MWWILLLVQHKSIGEDPANRHTCRHIWLAALMNSPCSRSLRKAEQIYAELLRRNLLWHNKGGALHAVCQFIEWGVVLWIDVWRKTVSTVNCEVMDSSYVHVWENGNIFAELVDLMSLFWCSVGRHYFTICFCCFRSDDPASANLDITTGHLVLVSFCQRRLGVSSWESCTIIAGKWNHMRYIQK